MSGIFDREHEVLKWGTHLPMLAAALCATPPELSVLELGAGRFSTVLLAAVAAAGRRVVTVDADASWLQTLAPFVMSPRHTLQHVSDWDAEIDRLASERWGVVFVDHWPPERRGRDVLRLADSAELLVLHDTECAACGFELSSFPFVTRDERFLPVTTVVSRKRSLSTMYP